MNNPLPARPSPPPILDSVIRSSLSMKPFACTPYFIHPGATICLTSCPHPNPCPFDCWRRCGVCIGRTNRRSDLPPHPPGEKECFPRPPGMDPENATGGAWVPFMGTSCVIDTMGKRMLPATPPSSKTNFSYTKSILGKFQKYLGSRYRELALWRWLRAFPFPKSVFDITHRKV